MVKALARPEKEGFILVTFFHGTNLLTQERYTDWDQDFLGHSSEPRMELSIPENTGTFDKQELRIILPDDIFVNRAACGVPHSPMYVIVEELTQGLFTGDQSSQKIFYRGRVVRTIKGYQGQRGRSAFFCLTAKSRLDVPMSIPANHQCANTVFHGPCGVVQAPFDQVGDIDSADGTEIIVTSMAVTVPGATDARYWKRGYLEKGGLRISIRDYDGSLATGTFYMASPVPTDWIGGTNDILFVPGCDKTVETCRARYNGEEFFNGLGFAIPSYQPNFESPS